MLEHWNGTGVEWVLKRGMLSLLAGMSDQVHLSSSAVHLQRIGYTGLVEQRILKVHEMCRSWSNGCEGYLRYTGPEERDVRGSWDVQVLGQSGIQSQHGGMSQQPTQRGGMVQRPGTAADERMKKRMCGAQVLGTWAAQVPDPGM